MNELVKLSNEEARRFFLKESSYCNVDMPKYISFEPILKAVEKVLERKNYHEFKRKSKPKSKPDTPDNHPNVNYSFITNKDGKLAWRSLELIHPVLYVSLVNVLCDQKNWSLVTQRLSEFKGGAVECCSMPVISPGNQTDKAMQVSSWWKSVEQRSLIYSLEFSHVLHTDVIDCYGSLIKF